MGSSSMEAWKRVAMMALFRNATTRRRHAGLRQWAVIVMAVAAAGLSPSAAGQSTWFSSWAGGPRQAPPRPAVARIVAEDSDGLSQGSGALIAVSADHGIVVTNWHVVRDAVGKITVIFPDGFQSAAQVLKVDKEWDLAALGIWRPSVDPLPVARIAPVAGESLTIAGYGPGAYREATGRLTQYVAPAPHLPYEMFEVDVEARNGDSGGPILNARGELAGVLFGAASGTTAASYCGRVADFLSDVLPLIGTPPPKDGLAQRLRPAPADSHPTPPPSAARESQRQPAPNREVATGGLAGRVPEAPLQRVELPAVASHQPIAAPVANVRSQPLPPPPQPRTRAATSERRLPAQLQSALRFMGETPLDQIKTFLAIVGVVSIVMQLGRGRGQK